jgi:hypothetical protein
MRKLSDKYLKMTLSRNYIAPGSLDTDSLDQKIRICAHSLASIATANQFVDDASSSKPTASRPTSTIPRFGKNSDLQDFNRVAQNQQHVCLSSCS